MDHNETNEFSGPGGNCTHMGAERMLDRIFSSRAQHGLIQSILVGFGRLGTDCEVFQFLLTPSVEDEDRVLARTEAVESGSGGRTVQGGLIAPCPEAVLCDSLVGNPIKLPDDT